VLMLHDHMRFAGDRELIERYLPGVDAVLGYFHRMRDSQGLVGQMDPGYWSFVDWAESWKENYGVPEAAKKGPLTVYSLMYAYALQHAAELAEFAGRAMVSEEYNDRANQMIKAVKDHCMSAIRPGIFTDGPGIESFSQHSQVWAVLSGAVSGEEARKTMDTAISDPVFVPCSFAMAFYLFRALSAVDLYDRVDDLFAPWRKMVRDNMTTWMEDTVSQRSDAHAWGSVPIYEYATEVLGIKSVAPGFAALRIQPRIGHLSEASGRVMTSRGPVDVEWYIKNGIFHLSVTLPEAIPCTLLLPDGQCLRIEDKGPYHVACELRTSSPAAEMP
jgi:alpha-L-rhamnosidase